MNIDSIQNGYVIDHISAGNGMQLYTLLGLDKLDVSVALIKNAVSRKMGRKDILKIDALIPINMDVIGYVDPGATVSVIKDGVLVEKKEIGEPQILTGVLKCKNPRCITSTEQELQQRFKLTNAAKKEYRCVYCETKASL